jgi:DNA polymerase III alpha subunit
MSGKYRSQKEFKRIEEKYFSNCRKLGYPEKISREVWRQIESFAGYSFSKAHSASYAVESFQSLYLKARYPLEFQVAVINNFGGFYPTWVYVNEARRKGADVELPCVNHSHNATSISGTTIWLGFVHVQNLEQNTINRILNERNSRGPFHSLADFTERIPVTKEQLILLIRLGAFRFTGQQKSNLLWEAHLLLKKQTKTVTSFALFQTTTKKFRLPQLQHEQVKDAYDEIELLGFPVSIPVFDMLQTRFRGEIQAKEITNNTGRKVRMVGRLVTIKYVYTVKKEIMHFGTFLDSTGEFFDTVHFPDSLKNYPFRGEGIYLVLGKIVEESGFPSLEVEKMAKLPYKSNPNT